MLCPYCASENISVVNSRSTKANSQIWRRRRCDDCHDVFTTYEKIDLSYLKVIKKSSRREYYQRSKLYSGIYKAASDGGGVDRGTMGLLSEKITDRIERKILLTRKKRITTQEIFRLVGEVMRVSYPNIWVRYLSYFSGDDMTIFKTNLRFS